MKLVALISHAAAGGAGIDIPRVHQRHGVLLISEALLELLFLLKNKKKLLLNFLKMMFLQHTLKA